MPPVDHDQGRELEAMRRYVESLGRDDEFPTAAPPPRTPWVRRALAAAAAVALLLAGIGIGVLVRPDRPEPAAARVPAASPLTRATLTATPSCRAAVDRANKSLAIATNVETQLREHTEYMTQLLHNQISPAQALNKGMPSLIIGAAESSKFDAALADYRNVVERCHLRAPPPG